MVINKISPYLTGAVVSTALSIFLGYFLESNICIVYSVLGAFSYAFFSENSLKRNIRNIGLHGILLLIGYNYGLLINFVPYTLPFSIALLFSTCYLFSEIFSIKSPKYFYVILLFTVGLKGVGNFHVLNVLVTNIYIIFGVLFSIISAAFVYFIYKLYKVECKDHIDYRFNTLSFGDKIYYRIYHKPRLLIISLHGAITFFIVGYLVVVWGINDSVWMIISCAAVISAEEIFLIQKRFKERILGSIIGIILGYFILTLNLPIEINLILLLVMNTLFEFFLKKNYLVANMFTNPLVLILSKLITEDSIFFITIHRLLFLVMGAFVGYFSMLIFYYCLDHVEYYK